jgi:hypothetical protein
VAGVAVELHLTQLNGAEQIAGVISNTVSGLALHDVDAAGWAGTFNVVLLPPTGTTYGAGEGTMTLETNGQIHFDGRFGDGEACEFWTGLCAGETWPAFARTIGGTESLDGWAEFTSTNECSGTLAWLNTTAGIATNITVFGSRYNPPARGATILSVSNHPGNAQIVLTGGNLAQSVTNAVTLTGQKVRVLRGDTRKLSVHIDRTTGAFRGRFLHPASRHAVRFQGMLVPGANFGAGWFLDNGVSGSVLLEPVP